MSDFFPSVEQKNDFPSMPESSNDFSVIGNTESARVVAEVQASLVIAKKFPRNEQRAIERIKSACGRFSLASSALYSYSRAGTEITGPSIRLLEAIKVQWGNIDSGWRELERNDERAIIQAYAWDKETNVKEERTFEVPLIRYTRKGSYKLSDPRDIYEHEANNASRRVRACLQAVIPADVIEEAVDCCIATQHANVDMSPEKIKALVTAFGEIGVTQKMIETRLQRSITSIQPGHVVQLRNIYKSLIDGVGKVSDFFNYEEEEPAAPAPEKLEKPEKKVEEKKAEPAPAKDKTATSTAVDKQIEKTFTTIKGTVEKFKAGKLNGAKKEDLENMIGNAQLPDDRKGELLAILNEVEEEAVPPEVM